MRVEVKGTQYASDHGVFLKSNKGNWYSLQTDWNWRKYEMPARVEATLRVVEKNAIIDVWKRG